MNEQNIEAKENSKSLLIDTYLNYTSSKFSKIQIQVIVINCLVLLMDGVHMTLLSTLIVPIKSEFGISDFQISSISSLMFILVGVSSYYTGYPFVSNNKLQIFKLCFLSLFISTFIMSMLMNLFIFILCRIVHGICIGTILPLAISLLCEVMPINKRASSLILTGIFFLTGACLNCILAYIILPTDLNPSKLYLVFLLLSIISLISYIYVHNNLVDSPRSLIIKGKHDEAIDLLTKIITIKNNSNSNLISSTGSGFGGDSRNFNSEIIIGIKEKKQIIEEVLSANLAHKEEISTLFSDKFKSVTIYLIIISTVNAFILYGSTFVLGITLKEIKNKRFTTPYNNTDLNTNLNNNAKVENINSIMIEQLIVYLVTLPSIIVAGYLIEHKSIGRKHTITIGYLLTLLMILIGLFNIDNFFLFFGLGGFFLTFSFQASGTFAVEVYPTKIRSLGMGFLNLTMRIAGFFSQPVAVGLFSIHYLGQFYFSLFLCLLGVYSSWKLPFDTLGKSLDTMHEEDKSVQVSNIENKLSQDDIKINDLAIV